MDKNSGRSLRRFLDTVAVRRQVKIAKQHNTAPAANQEHRYAKRHAMDCGRPNCGLCSSDRRNPRVSGMQRLTKQERIHVRRLRDETEDYVLNGPDENFAQEAAANEAYAKWFSQMLAMAA
ncbi:hypothetical protein [Burkholderia cenocepacia]|uniref:hypothetical protein n=1 Tax=Burkholderia cenocepacia TaxID=95486 RepID=UPI00076C4279|nr:hypothetical protein [Burkholderia cenocepacia]KWU19024.1 hypothetical protein AS149_12305 [Burkholderia cenocepacia]